MPGCFPVSSLILTKLITRGHRCRACSRVRFLQPGMMMSCFSRPYVSCRSCIGRFMNNNERADLLVIGSVAAGAAVTKRLAELGARVVCLEQGDWRRPSDYPSSGSDFEAQMQRPQFS